MAKIKPAAKRRKRMSLRQWWLEVGTDNVQLVADELGVSMPYMRLLNYRFKWPSGTRAIEILDAARLITPGFVPDLEVMLRKTSEPLELLPPRRTYRAKILPSKAYLAASSAREAAGMTPTAAPLE